MPSNKRQTHKPSSRQPPFRLERDHSTTKTVFWAVAISLGLHLPLLLALPYIFENNEPLEPTEFDATSEFSLTVVEQNEPDKKEKEEDKEERDGQFVSLPAPQKEERPDEARFRDQYNSSTEKEMARRDPGPNQNRGPGRTGRQAAGQSAPSPSQPSHRPDRHQEPTPPQPEQQPEQQPSETTEQAEQAEQATEPNTEQPEPAEPNEQSVDLEEAETAEEGLVEEPTPKQARPDPSTLFPSMKSAQAALGGGSIDYLRDVEEGEKTLLNRKESRYWSFMQRVKNQIVQEWSPADELRRRDPHGKVYGTKDRLAIIGVYLNGDGSLRKLHIEKPSGIDFWDEEGMRAIKNAAPFFNTPEGMKNQDGIVYFRFGFVLDIHTGKPGLFRIFR